LLSRGCRALLGHYRRELCLALPQTIEPFIKLACLILHDASVVI
jgi:hypothetical protein